MQRFSQFWRLTLALNIAMLLVAPTAQANDLASSDTELRVYEFPLLDFPYNSSRAPTMRQSSQLSTDFYLAGHNLILDQLATSDDIQNGQQSGIWTLLGLVAFDTAVGYLPLGNVWMHEEWHRASLGRRGINSTNNMYNLSNFATSTGFQTADVAQLKLHHPQDLVRVMSAGLESQFEQTLDIEKQAFFNNHSPLMNTLGLRNILSNIGYMDGCVTNKIADGDCSIWVYELFRPAAPVYFQSTRVLNTEEQKYLKKQRDLSLLNLIDPFLFGQRGFTTPSGNWMWNANLRHELTPFGYTLASNVFLKNQDDLNIFGTVHLYTNDTGSYPGIDVSLPRYPMTVLDTPVHITPRLAVWMQPENLMFRDTASKLGGLASVRLDVPLGKEWSVYGEVESKSMGWVAGNEYLGSSLNVRIGLSLSVEHKARWRSKTPASIQ
ncbi:MAG: hypothetical protein PHP57_07725 [Sideroxydans sp.]|nr:hypothetical protein [Sideroxydans sp.]